MKKKYVKPAVNRIDLDNIISLVMMTWKPGDGKPPEPPGKPKGMQSPFQSPFQSPYN
jgi:hypothetical protein